jgi:hypothetical protein
MAMDIFFVDKAPYLCMVCKTTQHVSGGEIGGGKRTVKQVFRHRKGIPLAPTLMNYSMNKKKGKYRSAGKRGLNFFPTNSLILFLFFYYFSFLHIQNLLDGNQRCVAFYVYVFC